MISFAVGRRETHAQSPATRAAGTASPTPDDAASDARRLSDLQRISDALAVLHQRRGSYPSTKNAVARLCGSADDAGCALKTVAADLAYAYGDDPYYYASNGERFVLVARARTATDTKPCPLGLPAELAAGPVICLSSEDRLH